MGISILLKYCNRPGLRWIVQVLVFVVYRLKGQKIIQVTYNPSFGLWEYKFANSFFLTRDPAWFSSEAYYLETLKKYSGHFYMPVPGDTVIDVGAGVGEEILPVSTLVGAAGKVFAIEANPNTFRVLEYYCRNNRISNAELFNIAIAESSGFIFIEDDEGYGVQNSIAVDQAENSIKVESRTLDDFIETNRIQEVSLLKVNIEGAERFLVAGMNRSIPKIKRVAISCHDFRFAAGESEFYKTRDVVIESLKPHFDLTFQQTGDAVRDSYVYGINKNVSLT